MINKCAAHGLTKEIAEDEDSYGETYEAADVHRDELVVVDRRGKKLQEHDYGAGTAPAIDSIREAEYQDHIDKRPDIQIQLVCQGGSTQGGERPDDEGNAAGDQPGDPAFLDVIERGGDAVTWSRVYSHS